MENVNLKLNVDGTYVLTFQSLGTTGEWDASGQTVWLKPKQVMGQPISRLTGPAKILGEPVSLRFTENRLIFQDENPDMEGVKLERQK